MQVTIEYRLSETGQRASLKAGGDGKSTQTLICHLPASVLDLTQAVRVYTGNVKVSLTAYPGLDEPLTEATALAAIEAENQHLIAEKEAAAARHQAEQEKRAAEKAQQIADIKAAIGDGASFPLSRLKFDVDGCPSEGQLPGSAYTPWVPMADLGLDTSVLDTLAARKAAEDAAIKAAADRDERIKALPGEAKALTPPTVQADGTLRFAIPEFGNDGDWAKLLQSVDLSKGNGMAFDGPWLKCGGSSVLSLGDIVVAGTKRWVGSKRSGDWKKSRDLFVATKAGLIIKPGNTPNDAALLLNADPTDRQAQALASSIARCNERIATLETAATDPANAAISDVAAAQLASWQSRLSALQGAAGTGDEDSTFTTAEEAALAIIRAGYRALAATHHPDKGGDVESMSALNAGRDALKQLLALAGGI